MNIDPTPDQPEVRKTISWLDRFYARVLFLTTPEYAEIKSAQSKSYGEKPTFERPSPMPLAFKTINGVRTRYAHQASPEKPTVILLNPLPQSIVAFAPIWEQLASQFNLYAYDLPGFGRSEGGLEFMTFEAQGRFMRDFISEFDIQRPHIVGPDIGMAAALSYVTSFENDVASLAIGDGPGIAPSSNGSVINKMVDSGFWRLVFKIAGASTFVHVGNKLCYVNYVPNEAEVSDYIHSYTGRISAVTTWFKQYPESLATVDPKIADMDLPVLVFWGAQDRLLLPENADRLSKRLKRSKLCIFDKCGHFSYQDQHEQFVNAISQWVQSDYKTL